MKSITYLMLIPVFVLLVACSKPFEFKLLNEQQQERVKNELQELNTKITLVQFTQEFECESCETARTLMTEIAHLVPNIRLEVYDLQKDAAIAQKYGVDKIPATVILRERKDTNVRIYGVPGGYEFPAFLESLQMIGGELPALSSQTKASLQQVEAPVVLEVMVTPT
ncbi:MAG: hypothetical protein D6675_07125 [Gemmatimonadetes bacterium]|nr:MAG: hypothetical protein D6675_07125 [Gemmatimonadota bacterium]